MNDEEPPEHGTRSWLDDVVSGLKKSREHRVGVDAPRAGLPLPSRDALVRVAQGLTSALFPLHFGPPNLDREHIDYFVGHTLTRALSTLEAQAQSELHFVASDHEASHAKRAKEIGHTFATRLPAILELIDTDVQAAFQGDPAARNVDEAVFCYPGIRAILHHRLAHELYNLGLTLVARIISEIAHSNTGIDIHPGASIGGRFFIDHGTGVVIGETAVVGHNVRVYQGVTLGAKSFPQDDSGRLQKGIDRHPIVEDDVVIYAGATILGRICIGRGSTIGGNVWLTRSVPPGSRVTQAKAESFVFEDGAGI